MQLNNPTNLGLTMALWLARDTYDHEQSGAPEGVPIISVTDLLQPTKALILKNRVPPKEVSVDLTDLVAARIGQAIHASIEDAFHAPDRDEILERIGTSPGLIKNIRVNPTEEEVAADPKIIPLYIEKRSYRLITCSDGMVVCISGKFDQVLAGRPEDNKKTSVYKYMKSTDSATGDYGLQMSLYKWLNPKIVTASVGQINFILSDWKRSEMLRIKDYPEHAVMEKPIQLLDEDAAEDFIRRKLDDIRANTGLADQDKMIRCTDEELWRTPDEYKYYTSQESLDAGKRASKNFTNYAEAMAHKATKGKGVIAIKPGEVRRCFYCDGAPLCVQRLEYQTP